MSQLAVYLLGLPRIELNSVPVEVDRRKALALLIYLAMTAQPHSRDALATLFWPGYDQTYARANLRRTLSTLSQALDKHWLEIERESVVLPPGDDLWLDVADFHRLLASCATHGHPTDEVCSACLTPLSQAVALYHDDFLTGFTLPDSPDFDDWQLFQTETLRQELADVLERLVRGHTTQGEYKPAMIYARRWLALDPLHEPAHRSLMQLYVQASDRTAALRQYQECVRVLKQELGVAPSVKTTDLYERIRQGVEEPESRGVGEQGSGGRKELEGTQGNLNPSDALIQSSTGADQRPATSEEPTGASPTTLQDEMRLVTILCADTSHAIETMWPDQPEETADLMKHLLTTMEQILGKYQARVDRFLGNGLLAVFGAPQLHEDDPERAIRAALEVRAVAQELGLGVSMGINTGVVYFGRMDAEADRDITVMGPVVNLAARLQAQAEAGQILVGLATYRPTQRAFRFSPLSLDLKGSGQPVTAYQVARLRRRPEKSYGLAELQAELIGRDEELAKLKAALAETCQGHGQMVSIIGEAGVGKSRLVAELKQSPIPRGQCAASPWDDVSNLQSLTWLEGRCLEMSMSASYWPFLDIFRAYFAWGPADDEQARAERLVGTLQEMIQRGHLSATQVEVMGPLLGHLLSLRFGTDWDERLAYASAEQIRHQTFQAVYDFFVALARQQPLVLVLEDLHWADSLSLDLIARLMEALPTAPLLLLCLYRPERQHKCWRLATIASRKCPAQFAELRLRELTPPQSRQLVETLLAVEELPSAVKDLILTRAQGNPFFVEEIVRSLIEAGLLYRDGDQWQTRTEITSAAVPENVQSVIQSRVDRLEPALKQVLQEAAVLGRLFRLRLLARLIPPELDLAAALERLEEQALIYQEQALPEVEYSFKHVLTQEAVYQVILPRRRSELHRQAAQALEELYPDGFKFP